MKTSIWKRLWSLLLVAVMVFEMMPVQAFALEDEHDHLHEGDIVTEQVVDNLQSDTSDTTPPQAQDTDVQDDTPARPPQGDSADVPGDTPEQPTQGDTADVPDDGAQGDVPPQGETVAPPADTPAQEPARQEPSAPVQEQQPNPYSDSYYELENGMNAILVKYLGENAKDMDKDTIGATMVAGGEAKAKEAQADIDRLFNSAAANQITDTEAQVLTENNPVFFDFVEVVDNLFPQAVPIDTTYGPHTPITGVSVTTVHDGDYMNGSANATLSNETVTITAQTGTSFLASKATCNITITNTSTVKSILYFDYTLDQANTFKIDGTSKSATSTATTYSKTLKSGESVTIELKSPDGKGKTATLNLSNFKLEEAPGAADVTVTYDNAMGTVKGYVNKVETVLASGVQTNIASANGVNAYPNSGYTFIGWVDPADNTVLSTNSTYPLEDGDVLSAKAVFAKNGGNAVFMTAPMTQKTGAETEITVQEIPFIGGTTEQPLGSDNKTYYTIDKTTAKLFDNLTDAANDSKDSTRKAIVLMNNAVLPAGNYEIPAGSTLLIPFDDECTIYTEQPFATRVRQWDNYYRTLTMASGANITVNGAISLSAKHHTANGGSTASGTPSGPISRIDMQSNSSITVKNGGVLYVWGYITGSGSVAAESGAKVHENFQFNDFRGGTELSAMDTTGTFPLSQYYVQNIQVPLRLYAGATEYSYTSVFMRTSTYQHTHGASVPFIGKGLGMFDLSDGYVEKRYDGTTDRLVVDVYGNISIAPISMSIANINLNSGNYELPINGNITVNIHTGSTIVKQDVALLPGAEINILSIQAECKLNEGIKMFIYDKDEWGGYCGTGDKWLIPLEYAPNRTFTRTQENTADAKVSIGGIVTASAGEAYTTTSGAAVCGVDGGEITLTPGADTTTKQYKNGGTYVDIPVTPVKLQNGDGNYITTAEYTETTKFVYIENDAAGKGGRWHTEDCNGVYTTTTVAICTKDLPATFTCSCTHNPHSYDGTVAKIPHTYGDWIDGDVVPPTCTTGGYTEQTRTCTMCEEATEEQNGNITGATGHKPGTAVKENHVEMDCDTPESYDTVVYCTVCNTELSRVPEKPNGDTVKGHTEDTAVEENRTESTCTVDGSYDTVVYCTDCDKELSRNTIAIPATGHTNAGTKEIGREEPTCTERGYSKVKDYCSVCEETYGEERTQVINAKGHATSGNTPVPAKAPTCTTNGNQAYIICAVCEKPTNNKTIEEMAIPATNHAGTTTSTDAQAATCTTDGWQAYYYCSACEQYKVGEEWQANKPVIPAINHINATDVAYKAETCTTNGTKAHKSCPDCGFVQLEGTTEWVNEENAVIPAAHKIVPMADVSPTCDTPGSTGGTECSVCRIVFDQPTVVPARGHDPKAAIEENIVEAKCATPGSVDKVVYCGRELCGAEISRETKEIPALDHVYGEGVVTTPATCTTDGEKTFTCTVCKDTEYADKADSTGKKGTYTEKIDALKHEFTKFVEKVEPTCLEDGYTTYKCIRCDETENKDIVEANGHTAALTEYVAPTCTKPGAQQDGKVCSVCNVKLAAATPIPATGHNYKEEITIPAKCGVEGEKTFTCQNTNCDNLPGTDGNAKVYTQVIPALTHQQGEPVQENTVNATCYAPGSYDSVIYCKLCNTELSRETGKVIEKIAHTPGTAVKENEVPAECEKPGKYDEVVYCSVEACRAEISRTEKNIKALDHDYKDIYYKAPTCMVNGNTAGIQCTICNAYGIEPQVLTAKGHNHKLTSTIPATCYATGLETYTCQNANCDDIADANGHGKVYTKTLEKVAHTSGTAVKENEIPATCYEKGSYDSVVYCSVEECKTEIIRTTGNVIEKIAHIPATAVTENNVAPSCTISGSYDSVVYCSVAECPAEISRDTVSVPATGHNYTSAVTTDPTCLGKGVKTFTCRNDCDGGTTGKTYTEDIAPLGHSEKVIPAVDPTCTTVGYTAGKECAREGCGAILEAPVEIPMAEHTYGEGYYAQESDKPTCTEPGTSTFKCSECEQTKTEQAPATGHDWWTKDPTPATCLTDGNTGSARCFECGASTDGAVIPATGHSFAASVTTDPTCTKTGIKTYTCTKCTDNTIADKNGKLSTYTETIDAAGHTYNAGIILDTDKPTCTKEGFKTFTCTKTNCDLSGDWQYKESVGYAEHTVVDMADVSPTCDTPGSTGGKECSVCREVFEQPTVVPSLGHSPEAAVEENRVEAKCATPGSVDKVVYCGRELCGAEISRETKEIPALDHVYGEGVVTTPATCTTDGEKTFTCTVCKDTEYADKADSTGKKGTYTEKIDQTGHNYDNGVVLPGEEVTCTTDGYITYTCQNTDCGHSYKDTVAAQGHLSDVILTRKEATCTVTGLTAGIKCSACGTATTPQTVIPAKGHDYDDGVITTTATCLVEGIKTFTCQNTCDEGIDGNGHGKTYTENLGFDPCVPGTPKEEGRVEAGCVTDGEYYMATYCTVCSNLIGERQHFVITATGHEHDNGVILPGDEPTCTEKGTKTFTCTKCVGTDDADKEDATGKKGVYTIDVDRTGHAQQGNTLVAAKAPTCTTNGNEEYILCAVCNKPTNNKTIAEMVIPAINHINATTVVYKAETCTTNGTKAHKLCPDCGLVQLEGTTEWVNAENAVIPAAHTDIANIPAKDSTCQETGWEAYDKCNACGEILTANGEIPVISKKEHTPGEAHNENEIFATCLTGGSYDSVVRCTNELANGVCGHIISSTPHTTDPLGHRFTEFVKTVEPTCEDDGYTVYKCIRCDVTENRDTVPANGHTETEIPAVAPDCLNTGWTAGVKCSVCDKVLTPPETDPALGHTYTEFVKTVAPTCLEDGYTVYKCIRCEETENRDIVAAAGQHEIIEVPAKTPTCLEEGYTNSYECKNCDYVAIEPTVIPATGHNYDSIPTYENIVNPDCTVPGSKDKVVYCSNDNCGIELSRTQEEIPATGHKEGTPVSENRVAPNCTDPGSVDKVVYCINKDCGEELSRTQEEIPATGHKPGNKVIENETSPSCEDEGGYDEVYYCININNNTICGHEIERVHQVIEPNGHKEEEIPPVETSCAAPGYTAGEKCSVCNEVLTKPEEIPALPHTPEVIPEVPATCTKTGLTEGEKCKVCDGITVEQEETPILEHNWGTGRITEEPDCDDVGVREFTCSMCRQKKQEDEPVLGHLLEIIPAKRPTYTDIGWEEYERCTRESCGHTTLVAIDPIGEPSIDNFADFIENLILIENLADTYVKKVSPGKDPAMLVIKYIRTGVDRYNSGSWNIMAGYEDSDFAKYVKEYENNYNLELSDEDYVPEKMMKVTGLKNLTEFALPSGDRADIGHVFGLMDISYTNLSNANVSGWGGDTVDLLSAADQYGVESTTLEAMVAEITTKYFLKTGDDLLQENGALPEEGSFSHTDVRGDLDGYYIIEQLVSDEYEKGGLAAIFSSYMTPSLTDWQRADYFIKNKLGGVTLRSDVRDAVFNVYSADKAISTLEGTRPFNASADKLNMMRKAVCYVFADYICKLAGDYVEDTENEYLTVFDTKVSTLAPGIIQKIYNATTADGQTMVYYTATADVTRGDIEVHANYNNNDPGQGWQMQRVLEQSLAAQANYSDPTNPKYTKDFNIVAAVNGGGYNMHNGKPGGLFVMEGHEWVEREKDRDFFGILEDGTAMIGTWEEYDALRGDGTSATNKVREAIGAFGTLLIKDGEIAISREEAYYTSRASRTAIGITASGKVVIMVVDGRQIGLSCGASMEEIAQIMLDAGCVDAMNLDGGGSSTYVAKPEGESELKVVSNPSDGQPRSVSTSIFIASTAPSSTEFDHAVVTSKYNYLTIGSSVELTAKAVSATGTPVDMPEGVTWTVENAELGTITQDGIFTATANGTAIINLMLDGQVIGSRKLNVVVPDNIYFENAKLTAIYGVAKELPVKAVYEGKEVVINENDAFLTLEDAKHGTIDGFKFTGNEESGLRIIKVTGVLVQNEAITATITLNMFKEDEASFDFDNATGGDREFAWDREVTNSTMSGANIYYAVDPQQDMVTSYTFALDMSVIPIPAKLADLTYMLPGADMENASAWNFLLQLAERVSVLTNVTAKLVFDPRYDVDYSEVTVSNEYFVLDETKGITFDEATNTLILSLNWVDQEQPIPAETANPLCIVSGIKLTPKAGAEWKNDTLNIVNTGDISYDIYLRANALYSFCQKPENQEQFGLKPFDNPDVIIGGTTEKGGHFSDVYVTFEDSYTLSKAEKEGWVREGEGWAYYEDGEKYTGYRTVGGLYYAFGDNGINMGQKVHTGTMVIDGKEYYAVNGEMFFGWLVVDEKNVNYYNEETGVKESLEKDETPSTCIIDGHCDYTSESGATKHIDYDDAGGHDWNILADGSRVCKKCQHVRVEMNEADVKLSYYVTTYTGGTRTPATTVTAPDGTVLSKPPVEYPDYSTKYTNNINVGTATATLTAAKYGKYGNLNDWFGNAAGSVDVNYEIRPDLPTNVTAAGNGTEVTLSWIAAKAPGVTYVISKVEEGKDPVEIGSTTELNFTFDVSEHPDCGFVISTRQEVSGKVYESLKNITVKVAPVVQIANNAEGRPTLTWTAVSGAEKYNVYRSRTIDGTYAKVFTNTVRKYTHSSSEIDKEYFYKVTAVFGDETESIFSNIVSGTKLCVGTDTTVSVGSAGKPIIEWIEAEGAAEYIVERSDSENGEFTDVETVSELKYIDKSAQADNTYYYRVVPVSAKGNKGIAGNVVRATAQEAVDTLTIIPGTHPTSGKPTFRWEALEREVIEYQVFRSETINGEYEKLFTTTGTTYTNTSAKYNKDYYYYVVAVLADGTTEQSEIVKNRSIDKLIAEKGVNKASGKPVLKWNALDKEVSEYRVYRSTKANGEFTKVFATKGRTYTHASSVPGSTYYYYVEAVMADGSKMQSDVVKNTAEIRFSIKSGNNVDGKPTVKWDKINGAKSYTVYRYSSKVLPSTGKFTTKGLTYTNTAAEPLKTYYYKVKVTLNNGKTYTSDFVEAKCIVPEDIDFNMVTGHNVAGKPTLDWKDIKAAEKYDVYRSSSANGKFVKMVTHQYSSYTNTNAVIGKTYYYYVKAHLADGSSITSDVVKIKCLG